MYTKLISIILGGTILLFPAFSFSAYIPSTQDQMMVDSLSTKISALDQDELSTMLPKLQAVISLYTDNERYVYIFSSLGDIVEDSLETYVPINKNAVTESQIATEPKILSKPELTISNIVLLENESDIYWENKYSVKVGLQNTGVGYLPLTQESIDFDIVCSHSQFKFGENDIKVGSNIEMLGSNEELFFELDAEFMGVQTGVHDLRCTLENKSEEYENIIVNDTYLKSYSTKKIPNNILQDSAISWINDCTFVDKWGNTRKVSGCEQSVYIDASNKEKLTDSENWKQNGICGWKIEYKDARTYHFDTYTSTTRMKCCAGVCQQETIRFDKSLNQINLDHCIPSGGLTVSNCVHTFVNYNA